VRVGVTGHSNLTKATEQLVHDALRDLLGRYSGDLVGVTCLARGADQIFARAVLDLGGQVEVILPAPDYRDAKVKPDNLAEFDGLLERASSVRYTEHATSGREAYMAASKMLLESVDRLVAVWDGLPASGYGGTGDVVEHARKTGVPVDVVWPDGAERQ